MKIRMSLKARGKMSPWQTPLVMVLPMEAKNKTANQTKSHRSTWKLWTQATRKGSSQKSPLTVKQCEKNVPPEIIKW